MYINLDYQQTGETTSQLQVTTEQVKTDCAKFKGDQLKIPRIVH